MSLVSMKRKAVTTQLIYGMSLFSNMQKAGFLMMLLMAVHNQKFAPTSQSHEILSSRIPTRSDTEVS